MTGEKKIKEGSKFSEILIRIFSVLVLVPTVLFLIFQGGIYFTILLITVTLFLGHEYEVLTKLPKKSRGVLAAGVFATCFWVFSTTEVRGFVDGIWVALFLGFLAMAFGIFNKKPQMQWAGFGIPYIAVPIFSLAYIQKLTGSPYWVFWLLIVIWACDTAAYILGTLIQGPKLAPKISPNKTWAGFISGMLAGAIAGGIAGNFFDLYDPLILAFGGALLAIWGQIGDLAESFIKRKFKVKDSGKIIPGHGGVLDRVDAVLFAAPALAVALFIATDLGI